MSEQFVVGVDFGGTAIQLAAVGYDGVVRDRLEIPSPARLGGAAVVGEIATAARRWQGFQALGIGAAGVIDPVTGTVLKASDSFQGWAGFALHDELSAATGVPVAVENDVNAFLLGEQRFGVARGVHSCFGIMLGTGVGGAVIVADHLISGERGAAAEIGHMPGFSELACTCGQYGHLETLASGRSIARRYAEAIGLSEEQLGGASAVAAAADNGDPEAMRCFADAGNALGLAMVQVATLFDLDTVVLGGGVLKAWRHLSASVMATVNKFPLISGAKLRVASSELGNDAVVLGAAGLAMTLGK